MICLWQQYGLHSKIFAVHFFELLLLEVCL